MEGSEEKERNIPLIEQARERLGKMAHEHGIVVINVIEDPGLEDIYLEHIKLALTTGEGKTMDTEINEMNISIYTEGETNTRRNYEINEDDIYERTMDSDGKLQDRVLEESEADRLLNEIINAKPDIARMEMDFQTFGRGEDIFFWARDRESIPFTLPFPEK